MKLGMVTYNMGKDMNREQLIALCKAAGLQGVEFRTTHAHGVEPSLSKEERAAVRRQMEESGVEIVGLGTTCEFQAKDPVVLQQQIETAKSFGQLAADLGCPGIKVRPNGLFEDEPVDQTCERIGAGWRAVAQFAGDLGVQVRMEVHGGRGSADPVNMRKMLDTANHPNAKICWNSNTGEQDEHGSIKSNFDLLKDAIALVHINEIGVYQYPWQELFTLLQEINYQGFCLAEIAYNPEPERFMKFYRTLFDLYTGRYRYPQ
ncbi:MAG: sugar phosphate isomerase/epimerase [Candidatus Hydrogenedentes bacterium]|nr:sugar phosphate isomerase/epimerase [Candidatus Hydrogenedentota bacterium]